MKILVTGAAGFIGASLSSRLLREGFKVVGIDNLNDYYDVNLKKERLKLLSDNSNFQFHLLDLVNAREMAGLFKTEAFDVVVNLAAQAGVRYSLVNPQAYIDSNLTGFVNVLEACRHNGVSHLIYASTSSVYGLNTKMPFSVHDSTEHPISLYSATKKANELMAHSYSHLFKLPTTGLRFFTVYGPWGRPDMALFLFTKNILAGKPIDVFNHGHHQRDFTYIDDIVDGIYRVAKGEPSKGSSNWDSLKPDPASSSACYRVYNIGNHRSVDLMKYVELIEECLGKKAQKNFLPLQAGDVMATQADIEDLVRDYGYQPSTSVEVGVKNFVSWYREYYRV